jgi:hypothetical protein
MIGRAPAHLNLSLGNVDHMLGIIRRDHTATVYANELVYQFGGEFMRPDVGEGEPVTDKDLKEVRHLSFQGVSIPPEAGFVFLFSIGWRKALFFDMQPLVPEGTPRDYDIPTALGGVFNSLLQTSREAQVRRYPSCFLSYAEADSEFVDRLYADLTALGVKVWNYKHNIPTGSKWKAEINKAIRSHERLLLVCSRESVYRQNVVDEILEAIGQERKTGRNMIVPVTIDDYIFDAELEDDGDRFARTGKWGENWVPVVKRHQILKFIGWSGDNDLYMEQRGRLLDDLRQGTVG